MNKTAYQERLSEIELLVQEGKFSEAVNKADQISLDLVVNTRTLMSIAKAYEMCRRYMDAEDILNLAKEHAPRSRVILYHLCCVAIKSGELKRAKEYYDGFVKTAPQDSGRFILMYKLSVAMKADMEQLIPILESYKEVDPDDKWMYELAKLYTQTQQFQKAVDLCREIEIWFSDGKYVQAAKELRVYLEVTVFNKDLEELGITAEANAEVLEEETVQETSEETEATETVAEEETAEEETEEEVAEESQEAVEEESEETEEAVEEEAEEAEEAVEDETEATEETVEEETEEAEEAVEDETEATEDAVEEETEESEEVVEDETEATEDAVEEETEESEEAVEDEIEATEVVADEEPEKAEDAVEEESAEDEEVEETADEVAEEETVEEESEEASIENLTETFTFESVQGENAEEMKAAAAQLKEREEKSESPENWEHIVFDENNTGIAAETTETEEAVEEAVEEETVEEAVEETTEESEKTEEAVEGETEESEETVEDETEETEEAVEGETETTEETVEEAAADEFAEEDLEDEDAEDDTELLEEEDLDFLEEEEEPEEVEMKPGIPVPYNPEITKNIWHFVVYGDKANLCADCAREKMEELFDENPDCPERMLKIDASKLKKINIVDSFDRFLGNMVIIQRVEMLEDEQLKAFAKILDKDDRSLLVAFTDTEESIKKMFERVPELAASFTAVYEGKEYTPETLLDIAKDYLYKEGAKLTEEAKDKVYEEAVWLLSQKEGFYENNIRLYVEKALGKAERGGFLGLMSKVDDEGFLLISEKHFK